MRWLSPAWHGGGLAFSALNLAAAGLLALRASMRWNGRAGVAWRGMLLFAAHAIAVFAGWRFGWLWLVGGGTSIAGLYCLAVLRPNGQWLGAVVRRRCGPPLLTFDDGPHPDSTIALLDVLDAHGEKAVFFLIGENARRFPEIAREIVRRGHEIGNHTQSHPQASFWCAGPWRTAREIRDCQHTLRDITGASPRVFRAPVGHRNLFTHPIASACGLRVVGWARRGYDADPAVPAARVIDRIVAGHRHGDIILLHDGRPDAPEIAKAVLAAIHDSR